MLHSMLANLSSRKATTSAWLFNFFLSSSPDKRTYTDPGLAALWVWQHLRSIAKLNHMFLSHFSSSPPNLDFFILHLFKSLADAPTPKKNKKQKHFLQIVVSTNEQSIPINLRRLAWLCCFSSISLWKRLMFEIFPVAENAHFIPCSSSFSTFNNSIAAVNAPFTAFP